MQQNTLSHCHNSHFSSLTNFDESGRTPATRDTFSFTEYIIEVFHSFHDYPLISVVIVRKHFQRLKVAKSIYLINYCCHEQFLVARHWPRYTVHLPQNVALF